VDCLLDDACDGAGTCTDSGNAADGTACGDPADGDCTDPDTCLAGVCQDNHATAGSTCGDQGMECLVDDACDGTGTCTDNGNAADGSACGDPSGGECTDPDTCLAGVCQDNHANVGTACGDQGVECLDDDACDGAGSCMDNGFDPDGTPCLDADVCNGNETCQGGGCTGGTPLICDVGEICDPITGCETDPNQLGGDIDHFMRYTTKASSGVPRFVKFGPVRLSDQFGTTDYDINKPRALLLPADKNLEGVRDLVTHLQEYRIKAVKGAPKFARIANVQVVNQCSDVLIEVRKPLTLLVPTLKDLNPPVSAPDPANHEVDHYLCYQAKGPKLTKGIQVEVVDQFQARRYDLRKIKQLCAPVEKAEVPGQPPELLSGVNKGTIKPIEPAAILKPDSHLVCYRTKLAKNEIPQTGCGPTDALDKGTSLTQTKHTPVIGIHTNNQFGPEKSDSNKERELCIPSDTAASTFDAKSSRNTARCGATSPRAVSA
jgi:hypothetical protein